MPKQQPRVGEIAIVIIGAFTIAAILFLAAMFVYFSGSDIDVETPKGSLYSIEDNNIAGRYYVTFAGSVKNKDIEIRITDASTGMPAIMDEPVDGQTSYCASGMSLTYDDAQNPPNHKLDGADQLLIQNGAPSDELAVVYKPSGEVVAMVHLT